jgi:hypothetical protein
MCTPLSCPDKRILNSQDSNQQRLLKNEKVKGRDKKVKLWSVYDGPSCMKETIPARECFEVLDRAMK